MYHSQNLKVSLKEWKMRFHSTPFEDFGYELNDFIQKIEKNVFLRVIINEAIQKYPIEDSLAKKWYNIPAKQRPNYESKQHSAAIFYQIFLYLIKNIEINSVCYYFEEGTNWEERKLYAIERYIASVINYLIDKLDESNTVTYLLGKYKRRTEWFFAKELLKKYENAQNKQYEQVFDDDLRLFLFEQGIDFPFSTLKTPSGRADIIGQIETNDPLIVEVKVFDLEKSYGKNRIKDGFSQCIKYANDFNKNVAYLALFNVSPKEIVFKFNDGDKFFPPKLIVGNKVFYFVVINLNQDVSASKIGKTDFVEIHESDLI
jgi:hypothetical protein